MTMPWSETLFELPLDELPIAGERLVDARRRVASVAEGHGRNIVSDPAVYATSPFIEALCQAARPNTAAQAAVRPDALHIEFGRNQLGVEDDGNRLIYPLAAHPSTGQTAVTSAVSPEVVDVPRHTTFASRPQPGRMAEPILAISTDSFIWKLAHWTDLLVANLLALQLRVRSITASRIAAGAAIHPTAIVENSAIEHGAVVGPYAVVRNSSIGEGVQLDEHVSVAGSVIEDGTHVQTGALVHGSVVGPSTVVSFHCALRGSVALGRSTLSTPVIARSLIGRDVFLARGVSIGASLLGDEQVRIRSNVGSVPSGLRLLGCAVGTGARVGNGTDLPPGYEVPAHRYLAQRPVAAVDPDSANRLPLVQVEGRFRQLSFARSGS